MVVARFEMLVVMFSIFEIQEAWPEDHDVFWDVQPSEDDTCADVSTTGAAYTRVKCSPGGLTFAPRKLNSRPRCTLIDNTFQLVLIHEPERHTGLGCIPFTRLTIRVACPNCSRFFFWSMQKETARGRVGSALPCHGGAARAFACGQCETRFGEDVLLTGGSLRFRIQTQSMQ